MRLVKTGELAPCEFINVESEFAAMSVAIGASATGARAFTATASQGLLFMMEALYNASGLGLPIVMTLANRAVGAPINIWNDHSDAMAARDAGWIQLFAETNQEAADLHILAFRLGEELSVPVMVCMDGFILTHATERVDMPDQKQVDAFLPPFEPRQLLESRRPVLHRRHGRAGGVHGGPVPGPRTPAAGARAHPRAECRVRRGLRARLGRAPPPVSQRGRRGGGRRHGLRAGHDQGRRRHATRRGLRIGALGVTSFRPFPIDAVRAALRGHVRSSWWKRPSASASAVCSRPTWPWP